VSLAVRRKSLSSALVRWQNPGLLVVGLLYLAGVAHFLNLPVTYIEATVANRVYVPEPLPAAPFDALREIARRALEATIGTDDEAFSPYAGFLSLWTTAFGESPIMLRWPSVLAGVLCFALMVGIVRRHYRGRVNPVWPVLVVVLTVFFVMIAAQASPDIFAVLILFALFMLFRKWSLIPVALLVAIPVLASVVMGLNLVLPQYSHVIYPILSYTMGIATWLIVLPALAVVGAFAVTLAALAYIRPPFGYILAAICASGLLATISVVLLFLLPAIERSDQEPTLAFLEQARPSTEPLVWAAADEQSGYLARLTRTHSGYVVDAAWKVFRDHEASVQKALASLHGVPRIWLYLEDPWEPVPPDEYSIELLRYVQAWDPFDPPRYHLYRLDYTGNATTEVP
jgi:hypothetical protein